MKRRFGIPAALFGFCAVALGAFAAHALRSRLAPDMLAVGETATRYLMYHALALLVLSGAAKRSRSRTVPIAGWCFVVGSVLFSGSLYILALTGSRAWGMVTPVGGVFLLAGWLSLAVGAAFSQHTMTP